MPRRTETPPAHHTASLAALDAALAAWEPREVAWAAPRADGAWSAQAETAHVLRALAYGADALTSGATMPLERPPWVAATLRTIVLPLVLAAGGFPRGGRAPAALAPTHPSATAYWFPSATLARAAVASLGATVAAAFASAVADGGPAVVHAYFGPMPPPLAWRVLSAHTRHHARALARRAPAP